MMRTTIGRVLSLILGIVLLLACSPQIDSTVPPKPSSPDIAPTTIAPMPTSVPTEEPLPSLSVDAAGAHTNGIALDASGDVDTVIQTVENPAIQVWVSGNMKALPSVDSNTIPDSYLQFKVDDEQFMDAKPTSHVRLEVDYLDIGTDAFRIEYDGLAGTFAGGGAVSKVGSGALKTAVFNLCDAKFANRDNGGDFRISDQGDGAEYVAAVRLIGLPAAGGSTFQVDAAGANPFDEQPDSDAIQSVLDDTCSGDTVVFTSGVKNPNYRGYMIDKTLFLTGTAAKHDLRFTASDTSDHALLKATGDLKGFVARLYARSRFNNAGDMDNIDFGYIDVDGSRDVRKASGGDGKGDGHDDNWGSWLAGECGTADDPWCTPGNIGFEGGTGDWAVPGKNPPWDERSMSTGIHVHDLIDRHAEAGTALSFFVANSTLENVTVDTAGDHVHEAGCKLTDDDGDQGGWSDGITAFGPGLSILNNTVINPSDVGIVYFGSPDTTISGNTIQVTAGNYGAFAGIAIHPWLVGDISNLDLTGNTVQSEGDSKCGGLHAGINVGPHMWGGGQFTPPSSASMGNRRLSGEPVKADVAPCVAGLACQLWAYIPAGAKATMRDNRVTGAQINYLIEGLADLGQFTEGNNVSSLPRLSDWHAARYGCDGLTWGAMDKVAHDPTWSGYVTMRVHCER